MKRVVFLFLSLIIASNSWATSTLIAHTIQASSDGSNVTTSAIDTTGANIVWVAVDYVYAVSNPSPTDSYGNTWSPATPVNLGGGYTSLQLFVCFPCTVGAGHTFSMSANSPSIAVQAWSNAVTGDAESGAYQAASATVQPGSISPSNSGNVLVAARTNYPTSTSPGGTSINSGFTISDNSDASGSFTAGSLTMAYKNGGLSGSENPTFTTGNVLTFQEAVMFSFTVSAATPLNNNALPVFP